MDWLKGTSARHHCLSHEMGQTLQISPWRGVRILAAVAFDILMGGLNLALDASCWFFGVSWSFATLYSGCRLQRIKIWSKFQRVGSPAGPRGNRHQMSHDHLPGQVCWHLDTIGLQPHSTEDFSSPTARFYLGLALFLCGAPHGWGQMGWERLEIYWIPALENGWTWGIHQLMATARPCRRCRWEESGGAGTGWQVNGCGVEHLDLWYP